MTSARVLTPLRMNSTDKLSTSTTSSNLFLPVME